MLLLQVVHLRQTGYGMCNEWQHRGVSHSEKGDEKLFVYE